MADTPNDKPVIKVESNQEHLTRQVHEGAAANLSDQALTSQIADSQKKAGADTRVASTELIYQADASDTKFQPKAPGDFAQFKVAYQALPEFHQDEIKDALKFHIERNQTPEHTKLNNEILTAMTA